MIGEMSQSRARKSTLITEPLEILYLIDIVKTLILILLLVHREIWGLRGGKRLTIFFSKYIRHRLINDQA